MLLRATRKLVEVFGQLPVVLWSDRRKGLSTDQARDLAHNVKWLRCVGTGSEMKRPGIRMEVEQLPCRQQGSSISPCLVDLLDDI
ncbi:hypothetical protein D3C87_1627930 [compost metagenome]